MQTLPSDVDCLSRQELVELTLRVNPELSVARRWTRRELLQRLRQWDNRVDELVALCVQRHPQLSGRRFAKEHYMELLSAEVPRVFTAFASCDVAHAQRLCSLLYAKTDNAVRRCHMDKHEGQEL